MASSNCMKVKDPSPKRLFSFTFVSGYKLGIPGVKWECLRNEVQQTFGVVALEETLSDRCQREGLDPTAALRRDSPRGPRGINPGVRCGAGALTARAGWEPRPALGEQQFASKGSNFLLDLKWHT